MGPHGTDLPSAYQQLLSAIVSISSAHHLSRTGMACLNLHPSNCVSAISSYQTQYTVLKTNQSVDALPNLTPEPQQQVYWYHDLVVSPFAVISDIPCDSHKTTKRALPFMG
jgi:hypothetical protein